MDEQTRVVAKIPERRRLVPQVPTDVLADLDQGGPPLPAPLAGRQEKVYTSHPPPAYRV